MWGNILTHIGVHHTRCGGSVNCRDKSLTLTYLGHTDAPILVITLCRADNFYCYWDLTIHGLNAKERKPTTTFAANALMTTTSMASSAMSIPTTTAPSLSSFLVKDRFLKMVSTEISYKKLFMEVSPYTINDIEWRVILQRFLRWLCQDRRLLIGKK